MTIRLDDIVFVFGALRSGTTVFRLMLDAHPDIANPGEMDFLFDALVEDAAQPGGWRYDRDRLLNDRIFRASGLTLDPDKAGLHQLEGFFNQLRARETGVILSINLHRNAGRLMKILPGARIVHILRDPRDVARSSVAMGWAGTLYHGVGHWIATEREWDAAVARHAPEHVLTLTYEGLFADTAARLEEVCAFCGLPYDPAMLSYHENSTYAAPDPSLVQQWKRKCDPDEIALLEARAGDLMTARGYALAGPVRKLGALERLRLDLTNKQAVWRKGARIYGAKDYWAEKVTRRLGMSKLHKSIRRRMQDVETARLK